MSTKSNKKTPLQKHEMNRMIKVQDLADVIGYILDFADDVSLAIIEIDYLASIINEALLTHGISLEVYWDGKKWTIKTL